MKKKTIAYHEAGHAVASVILRRAVVSVSILPVCGESAASTRHRPFARHPLKWSDNAAGSRILGQAIVAVAGPAAHARHGKKATRRVLSSVRCRGDRKAVEGYIALLGGDMSEDGPLIIAEADKLVNTHWPAIEAVAEELLRVGTISGKRLRAVVRSA